MSLPACSPTQRTHQRANPQQIPAAPSPHLPPPFSLFGLFPRNLPVQSLIVRSARNITRVSTVSPHSEAIRSPLLLVIVSANLVHQSFQAHHRAASAFLNSSIPSYTPCIHIPISFNSLERSQSTQTGHLEADFCTYEPVPFCPQHPKRCEPQPRKVGGDK